MVYELYGLTKEEREIVRGKKNDCTERKNKSSVLYEDLKESLEDILSFERGTSNLKFVEDTVTLEDVVSPDIIYFQ